MALVILVGACHVVVVRGNFFGLLLTKVEERREGTKEAERHTMGQSNQECKETSESNVRVM